MGSGLWLVRLQAGCLCRVGDRGWTRIVSRLGGTRSGAPGGYGALLQNAGVGVVGDPERCSGLVYGVPLGHGVAWCSGWERGEWLGGEWLVDGFSMGTGFW